MTTYTVFFRTDVDYAKRTIDAKTAEHALNQARTFLDERCEDLAFVPYDGSDGVNEIDICGPGDHALWRSDELWRRLAADDLLAALETQAEAAQAVIDTWEEGDLAGAVRRLDAAIPAAREAIAKAQGGVR